VATFADVPKILEKKGLNVFDVDENTVRFNGPLRSGMNAVTYVLDLSLPVRRLTRVWEMEGDAVDRIWWEMEF